jgi:SAM-dependent methyltransferase
MTSTDFYDCNAEAFYGDTVTTDMTPIYERFLPLVKPGGAILEAGCGSGRDALAFIQRGYKVDAFDGSIEMVRRASGLTGIAVKHMVFEDILTAPLRNQYDAIWCCASLLHLERHLLPAVLTAMLDALVPGGIMYLSFKHGESERIKDGRWFTDLTQESLSQLLISIGRCKLVESWITGDQRLGRSNTWLNATIRTTFI